MRSIRLGSRTGPILGLAEILGHNRTSRNGLTNFTTIQIPIGLSNIKSQLCRAKGPIRCCVSRSIIFRRGRLGWYFPCMFAHLLFLWNKDPRFENIFLGFLLTLGIYHVTFAFTNILQWSYVTLFSTKFLRCSHAIRTGFRFMANTTAREAQRIDAFI